MLGFATLTAAGMTGAGVQMFSHGVMTALFFAAVGMVYDRAHTREIPKAWAEWSNRCPGWRSDLSSAVWFRWACPVSQALWRNSRFSWVPGKRLPWVAIVASLSIVITAAYILIAIRKVFFGDMPEEFVGHIGPISALDKMAIATLVRSRWFCWVCFPWLMVPMVQTGVKQYHEPSGRCISVCF